MPWPVFPQARRFFSGRGHGIGPEGVYIVRNPHPDVTRAERMIHAPNTGESEIAAVCNSLVASRAWVHRNLPEGLSPRVADVVAVRLGLHPVDLWSDWFAHTPDDEDPSEPRPSNCSVRIYHHFEMNYTPIDTESGRRLARR